MKTKLISTSLMMLGLITGSYANEIEWITPSKSICINNGGKFNTHGCYANWNIAQDICMASGGVLPTIDMLKSEAKACGADIENSDKNRNNTSYQSCYKKKGFSPMFYWSSTSRRFNVDYFFFQYGIRGMGKTNVDSHIRCVKIK